MSNIANNENEELAVLNVVIGMGSMVLAGLVAWLTAQSAVAAAWLITHRILVEPAGALIPLTEHAGLDLVRIVAIVAIACAIGFGYARFKPHPKTATR